MDSDEDTFLSEEKDRTQIREELSHMSFENLQKLKEKLGSKVYNETMFGTKRAKRTEFKRENKNRPREVSAKKQVPRHMEVIPLKKNVPRDPRFDSLCGTFNEKAFKNSYAFLTKLRENDLAALKKELKECDDLKRIKKIKYLIQRLENQLREENKKKLEQERNKAEKQEIAEAIKEGKRPSFKKKSEKKILNLVTQYEELKTTGKLKKHIQRLRKKNTTKDRRKLITTDDES